MVKLKKEDLVLKSLQYKLLSNDKSEIIWKKLYEKKIIERNLFFQCFGTNSVHYLKLFIDSRILEYHPEFKTLLVLTKEGKSFIEENLEYKFFNYLGDLKDE